MNADTTAPCARGATKENWAHDYRATHAYDRAANRLVTVVICRRCGERA